jgi:AraC-like DNA-binding protein
MMMKICNQEDHNVCYCYENEENSLVKLIEIRNGDMDRITLSTNEIVFIMEGKIYYASCNSADKELHMGQFVFLPAGNQFCYKAGAPSKLLILKLTDNIHLCPLISIKHLYHRKKENEKPESLFPLEVNARLQHFTEGIIDTWKDGLKCKLYLRSEISKLLAMLPIYYSKDDLFRFFYPILSPDTTFLEFVRTNHIKYRTVNEFATAMNMTSQQFTRRFNNAFGQAPYEWMQQQKARMIYGEICQSNKPLKEIATDYGFTDQSNFNRFCKTFYETTPGKIRKNRT